MAFRVKPRDESFYRMIEDAGRTVADSAAVLMKLLDPAADRSAIASQDGTGPSSARQAACLSRSSPFNPQ